MPGYTWPLKMKSDELCRKPEANLNCTFIMEIIEISLYFFFFLLNNHDLSVDKFRHSFFSEKFSAKFSAYRVRFNLIIFFEIIFGRRIVCESTKYYFLSCVYI